METTQIIILAIAGMIAYRLVRNILKNDLYGLYPAAIAGGMVAALSGFGVEITPPVILGAIVLFAVLHKHHKGAFRSDYKENRKRRLIIGTGGWGGIGLLLGAVAGVIAARTAFPGYVVLFGRIGMISGAILGALGFYFSLKDRFLRLDREEEIRRKEREAREEEMREFRRQYDERKRREEAERRQREEEGWRKRREEETRRKEEYRRRQRERREQQYEKGHQRRQYRQNSNNGIPNANMVYFKGCDDAVSLKRTYRIWSKKLHPDNANGDAEKFKAMMAEYESLRKRYGI